MTRLTLDVSSEVNDLLNRYSDANHITKAEALRRAISLLQVIEVEGKKNRFLGIMAEDDKHELKPIARLIGI